jgi:predicted AAA+ superfamily ATPase
MLKNNEITEILTPFNFWGKEQEIGFIRETWLGKLQNLVKGKNLVVAVTGVRRAGKTYLTKQLLKLKADASTKENTLYVLLEDPKFDPYLGTNLLEEIYQNHRNYVAGEDEIFLVLDEIQNVPQWEKWVRVLIEKKEKVKVIVTGSSSKLLFSQLATTLTGRTLTLEIFPLSFKEFLYFKGLELKRKYEFSSKRRLLRKYLFEYITYGGFPQVVLEEDSSLKIQQLREIFEGIIYRDVIARHKIKDLFLIKTIAEIAINNFASLGSATRLRNIIVGLAGRKISPNSVLAMLSFLEEAFLIFRVPIFSYKVKEQKLYPKKFYCIDSGLLNAITIRFSENMGRLYENIVAVTLLREKRGENIFYWKSKEQKEVDFVIKEGLKIKQLIQVSYDLSNNKVEEREINALLKAAEELKCNNLLIITDDLEKNKKIGSHRIFYIPLWRWLLKE